MPPSFLATIADARARTLNNLIEQLTRLNVLLWVSPTYSPWIDAALMDTVTTVSTLIRVSEEAMKASPLPSRCPKCDMSVSVLWNGPISPETRPVLLRCRSDSCDWEMPIPESAVEGL